MLENQKRLERSSSAGDDALQTSEGPCAPSEIVRGCKVPDERYLTYCFPLCAQNHFEDTKFGLKERVTHGVLQQKPSRSKVVSGDAGATLISYQITKMYISSTIGSEEIRWARLLCAESK